MSDLIDRQAAIEALGADPMGGLNYESILGRLPSAQPSATDTNVPVKDCISRQAAIDALGERPVVWSDNDDYTLGARNQYDMDRLALETVPSAQQWIPCSERLPGKDEPFYVLCCDKHGEIMIGHVFACNDGETPYSAESEHEYMYDCVAWCPLPEPWKGDKNG